MHRVAIIGASGFTGAEFLRLCAGHPEFQVVAATGETQAGTRIADLYPSLAAAYGDMAFVPYEPSILDRVDLVFMGLPHGHSQALVPQIKDVVEVMLIVAVRLFVILQQYILQQYRVGKKNRKNVLWM